MGMDVAHAGKVPYKVFWWEGSHNDLPQEILDLYENPYVPQCGWTPDDSSYEVFDDLNLIPIRKGDLTVFLCNEHPFSGEGEVWMSVISKDLEHLKAFMKDFNISGRRKLHEIQRDVIAYCYY